MKIRLLTVELLRSGPPHNQLLSPLTQYLGVCGDFGAEVVKIPYEHASFLRRLADLRYESGTNERQRWDLLQEIGADLSRVLGAVPGFAGALTSDRNRLVHLRLVLSASELALLPFELAKVPQGSQVSGEAWLALQTVVAVCLTRRIRSVPSEDVQWPRTPKILFVAGDPEEIPFAEHCEALRAAIRPWKTGDGKKDVKLRILEDATLEQVMRACQEDQYTHVHVLAHGAPQGGEEQKFGLALRDDVVSGERFATAIASLTSDRVHRPTVVTVASCDSGQVGSVVTRGASFAHDLHQSGIPLVVASQFPLTKDGSVVMAQALYRDLMRGVNPLVTLHQVRTELHSVYAQSSHDWASLVVYEALPSNLEEQLEEVRYVQAKRAVDAALDQVDRALAAGESFAGEELKKRLDAVNAERTRLPSEGPFQTECQGLRASSAKRLAQAEFQFALAKGPTKDQIDSHVRRCHQYLKESAEYYRDAVKNILVNKGEAVRRAARLHWVMVQLLSTEVVLGGELRDDYWQTAKLSAQFSLDNPDPSERAWALGSLAELHLLKLADPALDPTQREELAKQAVAHAQEILELFPNRSSFPVASTCRQFQRYCDWWGNVEFGKRLEALGVRATKAWHKPGGLIATARQIVELLRQTEQEVPEEPEEPAAVPEPAGSAVAPVAETETADAGLLGKRDEKAFFTVEMLPARPGDSLWIEYGDPETPSRVLIDCGVQGTYRALRDRIQELPRDQRTFELFILTHIDDDHIGGAIPLFGDRELELSFEDVWFNGWQQIQPYWLGAKQGEIFSTLLRDRQFPWNVRTKGKAVVIEGDELPVFRLPGGMQLTLLSPTGDKLQALGKVWKKELDKLGFTPGSVTEYRQFLKRKPSTSTDVEALADSPFKADDGAPNGSSIAVLAEYRGKAVLLGADAQAPLLAQSLKKLLRQRKLKRLPLDAFKLPHHGSGNNLEPGVLKLLDCRKYLVSSDGSRFHHPDREAIARVIKYGGRSPILCFNYMSEDNQVWLRDDLRDKYKYRVVYPKPNEEGLRVEL